MLQGTSGATRVGAPRLLITPDGMPIPDKTTPLADFDPAEWEITTNESGVTVIRHRSLAPKET